MQAHGPMILWIFRRNETKPRQPALNENFNLPHGSHVKKHGTRLLIGRIAFLTCGKSDRRHLIGLHRFANKNLLCGFSVCKSQYAYNKTMFTLPLSLLWAWQIKITFDVAVSALLVWIFPYPAPLLDYTCQGVKFYLMFSHIFRTEFV